MVMVNHQEPVTSLNATPGLPWVLSVTTDSAASFLPLIQRIVIRDAQTVDRPECVPTADLRVDRDLRALNTLSVRAFLAPVLVTAGDSGMRVELCYRLHLLTFGARQLLCDSGSV
jgi:hypothetical protein